MRRERWRSEPAAQAEAWRGEPCSLSRGSLFPRCGSSRASFFVLLIGEFGRGGLVFAGKLGDQIDRRTEGREGDRKRQDSRGPAHGHARTVFIDQRFGGVRRDGLRVDVATRDGKARR